MRGALILLAACAATVGAADARAIRGVSCGGGFFVNAPDKRIFWVGDTQGRKTEVHDGSEHLVAMAECGTGVLSIFKDAQQGDTIHALYSADCTNLGRAEGATVEVFKGPGQISGLTIDAQGLRMALAEGRTVESAVCTRPDRG